MTIRQKKAVDMAHSLAEKSQRGQTKRPWASGALTAEDLIRCYRGALRQGEPNSPLERTRMHKYVAVLITRLLTEYS